MSIVLSGYRFEGPYGSTASLKNRGGVYAVLTPTSPTRYKVMDVGESARVRARVKTHDRKWCWRRHANRGQIRYAVHYTHGMQQAGRRAIEQRIRKEYRPPCGSQ